MNQRNRLRAVLLLIIAVGLALPAISHQNPAPPVEQRQVPPPTAYAGDAACAECHAKEANSYAATPHALDSSPASAKTILGDFTPDKAVLRTRNPRLAFVMAAGPDGNFYQSAVHLEDPQHPTSEVKRFDIVVGSGRHGQTYLYWQGDQLFELPVSYWTYAHQWVNSPGYPDGVLHWDREVKPRCLECHANYFTSLSPPANRYAKDSLILGIGCERCHGPGATHVQREKSATPPRPGSPEQAIVNPAHLSHDQQMSLCSLCHAGGAAPPIGPALTYVVGDNIRDYLKITPPPPDAPVDVHGNQVGALEQSKCYSSGKLTCSTCHDVHKTQENADAFSNHCLSCHQVKSCGRFRTMGEKIRGRCVECHMPVGRSNAVTASTPGEELQATMRAHRIAIYPNATLETEGAHPAATSR